MPTDEEVYSPGSKTYTVLSQNNLMTTGTNLISTALDVIFIE